MKINKTLPNVSFMGVGAPKCGTTWIAQCLSEHPEINFAKDKEVNYFLTNSLNFRSDYILQVKPKNPTQYHKQFKESQKNKILGEYNVHYLYDKKSAEKINKAFPNIKIIISLRNQADYLNSCFWFDKSSHIGHFLPTSFGKESLDNKYFKGNVTRGYFSKYVETYLNTFNKNNVLIVFAEDIKKNPQSLISKVYKFVGVDCNFVPQSINMRVNKTKKARFLFITKATHVGFKIIKTLGLDSLLRYILRGNSKFRKAYNLIAKSDYTKPSIEGGLRKKIINMYKADNKKLEKLLNSPLPEAFYR